MAQNENTRRQQEELEQLDERDFERMPLSEIEARTGLEAPDDPDAEAEAAYRRKAWRSYQLDVAQRDEWGTASQATELPHGEEPEL